MNLVDQIINDSIKFLELKINGARNFKITMKIHSVDFYYETDNSGYHCTIMNGKDIWSFTNYAYFEKELGVEFKENLRDDFIAIYNKLMLIC